MILCWFCECLCHGCVMHKEEPQRSACNDIMDVSQRKQATLAKYVPYTRATPLSTDTTNRSVNIKDVLKRNVQFITPNFNLHKLYYNWVKMDGKILSVMAFFVLFQRPAWAGGSQSIQVLYKIFFFLRSCCVAVI